MTKSIQAITGMDRNGRNFVQVAGSLRLEASGCVVREAAVHFPGRSYSLNRINQARKGLIDFQSVVITFWGFRVLMYPGWDQR